MNVMDLMFGNEVTQDQPNTNDSSVTNMPSNMPLYAELKSNIDHILKAVGNSDDVIVREIKIGNKIDAAVLYTDGLVDSKSVNEFLLESIMQDYPIHSLQPADHILTLLKSKVITMGEIKDVSEFETLFDSLLSGDAILLLDGIDKGLIMSAKGWESRGVTEASTELVIRGPKESFTENIRTNTALVRRIIKDPRLWLESKQIGKVTKTTVSLMYIKGIANDKIVEEARRRLDRIDIDGILESGYIEQLIQDEALTPFPMMNNTERPDVVAAELLEGRIAILVDGTPFVLLAPVVFIQFFQAAEDYYERMEIATLLRLLRFICFFIALLGPSLYIAVTTFHQEMIPTALLITLVAQREGVPFPAFVELFIMETSFEILREAGIRMPKTIGQAVSIVGTLVVGTAAVEAGLVSAAMVIVVSVTAISNFVFPSVNMAIPIRILRFPFIALAASFGLVGVIVGMVALLLHLCSLRSFGVPYMAPFGPMILSDMKDTLFRAPLWAMSTRPKLIAKDNIVREQTPMPKPPNTES